jgi:hypothetical protein
VGGVWTWSAHAPACTRAPAGDRAPTTRARAARGFAVERGVGGLPTAFRAVREGAMPHTAPFEVAAGSARGDATVLDGAAILAGIAAELLTDPSRMAEVRAAFEAS